MRCACLLKIKFIYIELFNSFFLPNCWFIEQIVLFIIFTLDFRVFLSSLLTENGEGVNHPSSYAKDAYYNQVYNQSFHISQSFSIVPIFPDDISWLRGFGDFDRFSKQSACRIFVIDQSSIIALLRFKSNKYSAWSLKVIEQF
jgi:hypothetical protein